VDQISEYRLQNLDAFILQVLNDPARSGTFFAASTPEQIVDVAGACGFKITAADFRDLLQSNAGEFWIYGRSDKNPINHLCRVFSA